MERTQRKRIKGFRLPENTRCVTRGTHWGNPYRVDESGGMYLLATGNKKKGNYQILETFEKKNDAHLRAKALFIPYIQDRLEKGIVDLAELKNYDYLACTCKPEEDCHADDLIRMVKEKFN